MNFVPQEFLDLTYTCEKCHSQNKIDWLRDRGADMGSIHHANKKQIWVRLSASEECPKCQHPNLIKLPVIQKKDDFFLFGDEASRELTSTAKLFTYSLVGTSKKFLPEVETRINEIKSRFLPIPPIEWSIHMKELWSGDNRSKHPHFKDVSLEKVKSLVADIKNLFEEFGNKIYKTNILLAGDSVEKGKKKQFDKIIKEESYILMVLNTVELVTKHGAEPIFIFDAEKNVEADKVIQMWASDAFSKGCRNILYCFLTHGIPIREPIFVKPASRPLLELADVLSFTVARYSQKLFLRQPPDIDCSIFGEVNYYTFTEKGQYLENKISTGYPWNNWTSYANI
jgi:hypothetical protein